jgi:glycosyltransferase involved in cell wall biosynthesis
VGTYNDIDILPASLAAFTVQSFRNFELVIADDGSSQNYGPLLKEWAPRIQHGIQHVAHEKHGFRKARILNRAIHVSRFDTLIFIDMDCLPHHDFVRNHMLYAAPRTAIIGRRAHLRREVIPPPLRILERGLGFNLRSLLRLWLQDKARVVEHGFVSPIFYESSNHSLQGSNFSVNRSDLVAVNGFNENFEGWGKEDMELGVRLEFSRVKIRNLRNKVIQYHLVHDRLSQENPESDCIFDQTVATRTIRAPIGLAEIREGDFSLKRYRT